MIAGRLASLHPARSTGTPLPAGLLTAAKAMFVTSTLQGYVHRLPDPFLPFLRVLDDLPHRELASVVLQIVVLAAGAALLLNLGVRAASLVLGLAYAFALLSSRPYYLNATVFLMCMFILIGLYERPWGLWLARWQFVVLYLGSAVNKLLEPDWRSGQYFEHWMHELVASPSYAAVAAALPPMWLSWTMGWATIVIEFWLMIALAWPRLQATGAVLALVFHTIMVAMAGTSFGIFYGILALALPIFFPWPPTARVVYDQRAWLHRALRVVSRALDVDRRFTWEPAPAVPATLAVETSSGRRSGLRAVAVWALYTPAFHLAAAVALAVPALVRYLILE